MHLSSLARALMCDCLTAAASCPRDPGLRKHGKETRKRALYELNSDSNNKGPKLTFVYIVLNNLQSPRELLFILPDPPQMLPVFTNPQLSKEELVFPSTLCKTSIRALATFECIYL